MTNFEWLLENEKDLVKCIILGGELAKQNGKPKLCSSINCDDCDWEEDCGRYHPSPISKWLDEEYNPYKDWEIDDKVEVSIDGKSWKRAYFAGVDKNGYPQVWGENGTSWIFNNEDDYKLAWRYARKVEE